MKDTKPWTIKYHPQTLNEFEAQKVAVGTLKDWVSNFKKEKKKAALVYGPSGCGKTAIAHVLANELNLELIEINASDVRNESAITEIIGHVSKQQSLFAKGKIILVDEIDAVAGTEDRGGIQALINLIPTSAHPMILTAKNAYHEKLSKLRSQCELVQFEALDYMSIYTVFKRICMTEQIEHTDLDLKILARASAGDIRAGMNDLQTLTIGNSRIERKDIDELPQRRQTESILKALVKIFKVTDPNIAKDALENIDEDFNTSMLWLDENLPKEYTDPKDLAAAYHWLSRADVFNGRIRRRQHWHFLVYVKNHMTLGVALCKKEKYKGFTDYKPTDRILTLWKAKMKYQKRTAIAEKIAQKTHTSKKHTIQETLPYLSKICKENKEMLREIGTEFELDKEEQDWLSKT